MKTFKKFSALLLALMMVLTLFACNSEETNHVDEPDGKVQPPESRAMYAFNDLLQAVEQADVSKFTAVLPYSFDAVYEIGRENITSELEANKKELEKKYGEGFMYINTDYRTRELDSRELEEIQEEYDELAVYLDTDVQKVCGGFEFDCTMKIKGDKGETTGECTVIVIAEGNEWDWVVFDLNSTVPGLSEFAI